MYLQTSATDKWHSEGKWRIPDIYYYYYYYYYDTLAKGIFLTNLWCNT